MQKIYYYRVKTWCDFPFQDEIFEDYISYGFKGHKWVEICRTPPLADMKERQRLVAEALKVDPSEIELLNRKVLY